MEGDVISASAANPCGCNERAMLEIENNESEVSASENIDVYDNASEMVGKIDKNERIRYDREILLRLESLPQSRMKVNIEIPGVAKGDLTGIFNPSIAKKTSKKVKQLFSSDISKDFKRDRTQSEPALNTDIVDHMNGMKIDQGTACMSPSNIRTIQRDMHMLTPARGTRSGGQVEVSTNISIQSMESQLRKTISDWNTTRSNKSSRFQVKKSELSGVPVLAPSGGTWGRSQGQVSTITNIQSSNLPTTTPKPFTPPRFNRFQGCEPSNHQSMSTVPNPVKQQNIHSLANFISGNSKTAFNGKNHHSVDGEISSIDVRETVKDFIDGLQERKKNGKLNDSVYWIRSHFKGDNIYIFIEELSRQICCKSDEFHQNEAGALVRLLLKYEFVNLDAIIKAMVKGFVKDLPDILIHQPKAIVNVATYLSEIFFEEDNTDWKIQLVSCLIFSTTHTSVGMCLIQSIGEFIRMRQACKGNIASHTTMTFKETQLK